MSPAEPLTPLARSLLGEIRAKLAAFCASGEPTAIDLRSLPLADADRAALDAALGRGAVEAVVTASGESEVWETSYAGVWWARHYSDSGRLVAERIEITAIPDMLPSQADDIAAAAQRLADSLSHSTDIPQREEIAHAL